MARLCERPGCSEPGAASYGMVAEDLLFWLAPLDKWVDQHAGVLCKRHADAMVVPRGWILDDRREPVPRLFRPKDDETGSIPRPSRRRTRPAAEVEAEQLRLEPPPVAAAAVVSAPPLEPPPVPAQGSPSDSDEAETGDASWRPEFDVDDDLDGLLEVRSPLLARAFRGTDRPRR